MSRARDLANFADGTIDSATISTLSSTALTATSASVSTASLIQPNISSKPLIIKSAAPSTGAITGATVSSGSVIYAIASASATFSVNDLVTITGITPDTLNDTRAVVGAVSASSITIVNAKQGTYSSGGTATRIHANLLEIQNSAGTALSTIRSDGSVTGGFNSGLTLLNTTSFSGVSSQSINDVFSTTYDNYRVLVKLTAMSSTGDFQFRYRVSSADNTTSNYNMLRQRSNAAAVNTNQDTSLSYLLLAAFHSTTGVKNCAMDIMSPFLTENSQITFVGSTADNVNNQIGVYLTSGGFNTTTSFTGFTIFPASGTMTGSVSVFGYSK